MIIVIHTKKGTVSIDDISRDVIFPIEYSDFKTISYDTDNPIGLEEDIDTFTMASVMAVCISLWYAAAPSVDDMWELIKLKRSEVNAGGILVEGRWYHTDAETLIQYSIMYAAISANSLPNNYIFNANWKTMGGIFRPMPVSLLRKIINVGIYSAALNFTNAERHKRALMVSSVPSKYDYSTGWTKVYTNENSTI
jgi:hypothetical protein